MTGTFASSTVDTDMPDRAVSTVRPWADSRPEIRVCYMITPLHFSLLVCSSYHLLQSCIFQNMKPANIDAFNESLPEKSTSASYGGNGQSFTLSSKVGLGIGRTAGRVTDFEHDKTWYESASCIGEVCGQRNGLSLKRGSSIHEATKSLNLDAHVALRRNSTEIPSRSSVISRSWKDSEEEQFMWDNMEIGVTDNTASSVSSDLGMDHWTTDDEGLVRLSFVIDSLQY